MNNSKRILLFLGLEIFIQVALVEADYLVAIRIHDFSTTCDDCATSFLYCVDQQCLESHQTLQPGTKLDFSREFILLRQNPILFRGSTPTWDRAQVTVAAQYQNLSKPEEIIILSEAQLNLSIDNVWLGAEVTPPPFIGPMGHSNLTISVVVTCAENWFGQHCNNWCQGPNCVCNQPTIPCHDNCVGVVCGANRHCVDGVDQYVCTCDQGFTGRLCEINPDDCGGFNCSGNGRCIDGPGYFQCECDSGYSGALCEITDTEPDVEIQGNAILDQNALEILITGVIGWALLILLALAVFVACICKQSKTNANRKYQYNQQERYQSSLQQQNGSSNATAIPTITQSFHPGQSATNNITSEQIHQNVSYHAMTPEIGTNVNYTLQVPGVATTRVNISHRENESTLVYNHAYADDRGSGLYEELDCA